MQGRGRQVCLGGRWAVSNGDIEQGKRGERSVQGQVLHNWAVISVLLKRMQDEGDDGMNCTRAKHPAIERCNSSA